MESCILPEHVIRERYRINGRVATLVARPSGSRRVEISVDSDCPFTLVAEHQGVRRQFAVRRGPNRFAIP